MTFFEMWLDPILLDIICHQERFPFFPRLKVKLKT
jgi:hypothetical protein